MAPVADLLRFQDPTPESVAGMRLKQSALHFDHIVLCTMPKKLLLEVTQNTARLALRRNKLESKSDC